MSGWYSVVCRSQVGGGSRGHARAGMGSVPDDTRGPAHSPGGKCCPSLALNRPLVMVCDKKAGFALKET